MQIKEKKQLGENFGCGKNIQSDFPISRRYWRIMGQRVEKEENFYMIWLTNLIRS